MTKIIGIIGGMGPAATIDLLTKIYSHSSAEYDQDHVRVLADIDPTIPDRTDAILNQRWGIVPHLVRNARGLVAQGAEILAMPCNTAHAFAGEVQGAITVPLVSIVDRTLEAVLQQGLTRVGLLATDGTLTAGLYTHQFARHGVDVLLPGAVEQRELMQAIYGFKGGETVESSHRAAAIFQQLLEAGAQQVIAACTELPILLAGQDKVLDPTTILAAALVELATGG